MANVIANNAQVAVRQSKEAINKGMVRYYHRFAYEAQACAVFFDRGSV